MKRQKKWILTGISLWFFHLAMAQNPTAQKYAESITVDELKTHMYVLAHDSLEGRNTGDRGQKVAAEYIKNQFQNIGLEAVVPDGSGKSYFQAFDLYKTRKGEAYLKVGKKTFNDLDKIVYWGSANIEKEQKFDAVYVAEMTDEALAAVDVKGKAVVVPVKGRFTQFIPKLQEAGASAAIIIGTDASYMDYILRVGKSMNDNPRLTRDKPGEGGFPSFIVSEEVIEGMFKNKVAGAKGRFSAKAVVKLEAVPTENVLGFIEGTDKKDEVLVITAHYDHVGVDAEGNVFNGADDDASGTTAVITMARAFQQAKNEGNGPRRSILFMPVTGEERGLLGSAHYADNPIFPLENTIANLNLDMIGRTDSMDRAEKRFIYLVGSDKLSSELHEISEQANKTYTNLYLDYTYNSETHPMNIYYRSDHWNFAKNGIPVIFYFNGIHEDYHKITDTVDKIEWEHMLTRTHLVFYTAWELANRDERIVVDKK
jgi:hypothetical protein